MIEGTSNVQPYQLLAEAQKGEDETTGGDTHQRQARKRSGAFRKVWVKKPFPGLPCPQIRYGPPKEV